MSDLITSETSEQSCQRASALLRAAGWFIGGVAIGAAILYLLDPDSGRRRRATIREKTYSGVHETGKYISGKSKHLRNKARGLVHDAGQMFSHRSRFSE